ncbi:hypothetical protein MC885_014422 [Smutsia gigantea]|nr:hypothetical protein MC885_014422 [Smutsia gigantea]
MSMLMKKPDLMGLVVFLLTVFWGSLGFTALYRHLPTFLEWTLCLLSPFAFTAGMAQPPYSHWFLMCLYLVLTLYFDKILPTQYGHQHSPWFFLRPSFCSRHQRVDHVALENKIDSDSSPKDSFEPMSPEFQGKKAIRQ